LLELSCAPRTARYAEHAYRTPTPAAEIPPPRLRWDDAQESIAHFKLPKDFKATVWAASRRFMNPSRSASTRAGALIVEEPALSSAACSISATSFLG